MDKTPQPGINDTQAQPTAAPADAALPPAAPCSLPTPPARNTPAAPPYPLPPADESQRPADEASAADSSDSSNDTGDANNAGGAEDTDAVLAAASADSADSADNADGAVDALGELDELDAGADEAIGLSGSGSLSEILASMSSEAQTLNARFKTGESARRNEPAGAAKSKLLNATPYPDILLHSLPRQDALRFKWHLGRGLPAVFTPPEEEEDAAAHLFSDPAEAAPAKPGFLRLFGLLPSGEPWEKRINFADFPREGEGIFIGRDPSICRIVIPEESVSRCHAKLELSPKGLVITDQGSRNGVYVNGQQLAIYERQTPINDGDTLSLGDTSLCVEINT